ncbi:MAG: hypothetical protein ABJA76_15370 [Mucilaginibacter sp.]
MKSEFIIPGDEQDMADTCTLPVAEALETACEFKAYSPADMAKSGRKPYFKFYKVMKTDTRVTEISTNDFELFTPDYFKIKAACRSHSRLHPAFFIAADGPIYCGFLSRFRAMEHAKAGALKYIAKLIDGGEQRYGQLLKYRSEHFDDLNVNLTDGNIQKLEMAAGIYSN